MFVRVIHFVERSQHSFFLLIIFSYLNIHNLSILLDILGYFQSWLLQTMLLWIFLWMPSMYMSFSKVWRSGIAESWSVYIFKITRSCQTLFPQWFYQFHTLPLAVCEILHYSRSLSTLRIVTLFANLVFLGKSKKLQYHHIPVPSLKTLHNHRQHGNSWR